MEKTDVDEEAPTMGGSINKGGGGAADGNAAAADDVVEKQIWDSPNMQGIIYDYFTPQFNAFWGPRAQLGPMVGGLPWDDIIS